MITKNEFTPENWIFDLDFDLCDTLQGYLWGEGHLFLTSTTRKLVFTDGSLIYHLSICIPDDQTCEKPRHEVHVTI